MHTTYALSPLTLHVLLLGGGLAVALGSLVWLSRNTHKIAATEFGLFLAVLVLWIITHIVELLGGPTTAYYASFLIRGLRGLMVFSWFYFTMTYAGYGDLVHSTAGRAVAVTATAYLVLLTSVPPIATELVFPSVTIIQEPFVVVDLGGMTPFRRTTQAVGYSLFAVGTVGLTYRFVATGYTRLWRPVTFLGTALFIVALDLVFEKRAPFLPGVDYAAAGTPVAAVVLIVVLYRHDLLGSVPVGRDHLFRTLRDPVFVLDADCRIVDCNDAATSLCRADCRLGDRIGAALPGGQDLERLVSSDPEERSTLQFDRDGDGRHYEPVISGIPSVAGSQVTMVILRDVTELMRERQRIERQNERLETVAGVVSNDLRIPLDAVDLRLELARGDVDSEHLDAIARASARMDGLIDDLLTLAHHGAEIDDTRPVDLVTLTESCWRTVATGDATLVTDVGRTVDADPGRLRRLLENLMKNSVEHGSTSSQASPDNAVEHGGDGVTVRIGELETGFYVEDDGPGIPADEHGAVFEAGHTTGDGNTGFGLAIVSEVVDAHGWTITVTESDAGGARFEITGVTLVE